MNLTRLIAAEFPQKAGLIYLNHAGISPWPQRTAECIKRFADENVHQGPQDYSRWLTIESALRKQLQQLLNAPSPDDIALLKNTSEGLSMVAAGLPWQPGENIVSSDQEFPSNRIVWESLQERGVSLRQAHLEDSASPEDALFSLVDEQTRMIAISSVQYTTGLRMDLERIGAFCKAQQILFCIDAIQSLGVLPLDVQTLQADFVAADGHKWLLGPEGLAVLYVSGTIRERLRPTQYGWHMVEHQGDFERREWEAAHSARKFECGSPNMLGIHGLSASLSLLQACGIEEISRIVLNNSAYLHDNLSSIRNISLLSEQHPKRLSGIISFRHRQRETVSLHQHLQRQGIICAVRAGGIRLSPHFYNNQAQLDQVLENLA